MNGGKQKEDDNALFCKLQHVIDHPRIIKRDYSDHCSSSSELKRSDSKFSGKIDVIRPQFVIKKRRKGKLKDQHDVIYKSSELIKCKSLLENKQLLNASKAQNISQLHSNNFKKSSQQERINEINNLSLGSAARKSLFQESKQFLKFRAIQPFLRHLMCEQPFLNQTQIKQMVEEELEANVSQQAVSKLLAEMGYTKKKRMYCSKQAQNQEIIDLRYRYAKIYLQQISEKQLLFIDQIGFSYFFQRQLGYAPKDQQLKKSKKSLKNQIYTLIMLMGYEKILSWQIVEGQPNSKQMANIMQSKKDHSETKFLIMDNSRIHKTQQFREAVGRKGLTIINLPPSSPQLNPTQIVFGQIKNMYKGSKNNIITKFQNIKENISECCRKLQIEKFWYLKNQITHLLEKALEKKQFFNVD